MSSNASYATVRQQAEEKWKTFHWRIGKKGLFLLQSKKEPFTLSRYHEELRKDYKNITLFLCPDHNFQIAESNFD